MKKTIHLFCLPFAGGNKYSFREYAERIPPFLQLTALEGPGHGARIKEPLISDIDLLVEDYYRQIKQTVDEKPYAIYGHSMGGLLTYLLALKLIKNNHTAPLHLFITGTTGPSAITRTEKKRHLMGKEEFVAEIKDLGGMPDEILQNEDLLYYFEPILRSDFRISENYVHKQEPPLNIPITVITGTEEDMEMEDIRLWQNETTHPVDFKQMPGNHFFIYKCPQLIVDIISKKLSLYTKAEQL